ncbi:MAG TPA: hypothetical protein VHL81_08660, partial [Gemmatimonadales bacterium]|nr:hypothetical protein [Gemmatimonadales bacterium]
MARRAALAMARRAALALACAVALWGCAGAQAPGRTVSLRMQGGPKEATVTIDDEMVGTLLVVAARGVALP